MGSYAERTAARTGTQQGGRADSGLWLQGITGDFSQTSRWAGRDHHGKDGDILISSPACKQALIWKPELGTFEPILLKEFLGCSGELLKHQAENHHLHKWEK